jgi:hypothetical protein
MGRISGALPERNGYRRKKPVTKSKEQTARPFQVDWDKRKTVRALQKQDEEPWAHFFCSVTRTYARAFCNVENSDQTRTLLRAVSNSVVKAA